MPGTDGRDWSRDQLCGPHGLLVMFICNHCPYVLAVIDRIVRDAAALKEAGIGCVAISINDAEAYPEDSFERMRAYAREHGLCFPYLYDASQDVARAYGAVCTPDIYVYGPDRKLAYHGRIDDNWKEPQSVTKQELREAIDSLLAGQTPSRAQMPSMGCSIRWKKS